ncbi:hypothetical protein GIB67_015278 [Kingdonia uniflora]|uniref:UBC core domain-containing protein n=1 Tax=Kingdonia uniflora TaxID=39325 RepID=A0A7J7MT27_9MAGN|nr:hypothetical protein GIB67_015278 [Kingdonia uniflora]
MIRRLQMKTTKSLLLQSIEERERSRESCRAMGKMDVSGGNIKCGVHIAKLGGMLKLITVCLQHKFHSIYHDGTLCMDIIQDAWSPCHNVSTILTSVQSLLTDPNPASPANPEAAQLYQHDVQAYNRRVRRCARRSTES